MSPAASVQESFANLDGVHCVMGNSAERDFHPRPTAEFLCRMSDGQYCNVLPDSTCKCHGSLIKTRTEGCWVVPYRL